MSPVLLVVAHEATRTGAPRVLLDLLRHLKAQTEIAVAMRLEVGGPLADDLLALDDGVDPSTATGVLVNSALAAEVIDELPPGLPSALYVHEDGAGLASLGPDVLGAVTRYRRVYCVSETARADLVALGIERDRVQVIPPVVLSPPAVSTSSRAAARTALGAGPRDRVVIGCGEGGWRKGADLFVAVAARLASSPDLRFGWVGLRPRPFARVLDHDIALLGLQDRFRWLGEVDEPQPFLAAADVLAMPSRYDPQPLVPLQAAAAGTPTVGFDVGGLAELARDGAALTIPYPDVDGLGELVERVLEGCAGQALVDRALARWAERQSLEAVGPQFVAEITRLLDGDPT